jgi:hypothetical protein
MRALPRIQTRNPARDVLLVQNVIVPKSAFQVGLFKERDVNEVDCQKENEPMEQRKRTKQYSLSK